jgi:hypothetical protein
MWTRFDVVIVFSKPVFDFNRPKYNCNGIINKITPSDGKAANPSSTNAITKMANKKKVKRDGI